MSPCTSPHWPSGQTVASIYCQVSWLTQLAVFIEGFEDYLKRLGANSIITDLALDIQICKAISHLFISKHARVFGYEAFVCAVR